jgi:hypothetical protein
MASGLGRQHAVLDAVLVQVAVLHAVGVGADEVDRRVGRLGMRQEFRHPGRAGAGRAADAQLRIEGLEGPGGARVEVEIGLLVGLLPEAVEIGLVPDLEVPAAHFRRAIALEQVAREGVDQRHPALGLGVRGVAGPVEDLLVGGLQRQRCEAQLDEGLDAPRQQRVVEPVDAAEVEAQTAAGVARHGLEHVVEDGVKAQVAKAQFVHCGLELRQRVLAQQGAGIVGADAVVEEAVQRRAGAPQVELDAARRGAAGRRGLGGMHQRQRGRGEQVAAFHEADPVRACSRPGWTTWPLARSNRPMPLAPVTPLSQTMGTMPRCSAARVTWRFQASR